jgi:DNA (cytosine-5)-methyltransferase 1
MGTLVKNQTPAVAFTERTRADQPNFETSEELTYALRNPQGSGTTSHVMAVRRLTPEECEALQGFPRGYTKVTYRGKPMADGPRYKMLGNSWAVPCVRWIGERIQAVDEIMKEQAK